MVTSCTCPVLFVRQTLTCREYSKRHGLEIAAIYREDFTGDRDIMRRPAWSAMMDAILVNGVRTVLVERLVQKLRVARLRKRATDGWCEGRKPYGFRDGEREIVARIKRWRSEGVSQHQIAHRLNESNVRPRSGQKWRQSSVRSILQPV